MRHPNSSAESFSQRWSASAESLSSSLERHDKLQASRVRSFDDVQKLFLKRQDSSLSVTACNALDALNHALEELADFMDFVSNEAKPPTDNSLFWGCIGLVVQLSQSEGGVAPRVPHMITSICHNIDILNHYRTTKPPSLFPKIRDICFQIARLLPPLLIAAVKFIREDLSAGGSNGWEPLDREVNDVNSAINEAISRLDKLSSSPGSHGPNQLQHALTASQSATQSANEPATLPCFIYPASSTLRFFDRSDAIAKMDGYFNTGVPDANHAFRSLAVYGIAGAGKSSVALRYAERIIQRKELDAMFWIAGEKDVTIRQSFTDIAVELKLPGAQPKDHDENRTLVLKWLQNTECRWLLVFDNVESVSLLMAYWPVAPRGQAIITTRNHEFAFNPADGGLEITEWDTETGSQFLIHLLSADIGKQLTEEESHSAHELSLNLSGHALALSLMAGLIHRRSWSISEFVDIYKEQPRKIDGIFGNSSINALWDMSFRALNAKTTAILGVLAFLSADNIPQALFEPKDPNSLPESLEFCKDPLEFSGEIETLLTLALIKRNKDKRAFSLHRLVQRSFKHFIGPKARQNCFNNAALLVSAAFPRKDAEFSQMYQSWKLCSLYVPHVLSLRDCFREEKEGSSEFSAVMQYCSLNNACQRYLIETNSYRDLLSLLEVNAVAISTIPPQPRSTQVELEGTLASHQGQALARVGRTDEGIERLRTAYEIFATDQPRNLREEAWCAENLADAIASTNNFQEAVGLQEKARDHWLDWAKDNAKDTTEWPAILKWGMGTNLIWAGQNQRSKDVLAQGLRQLETTTPYNWAMAAYTSYSLGTVDRADGNFKSAERYFTEAYNKWISGDNLLSDPFCGACVYRMGCTALDQGEIKTAIKHLREASTITERHKVRMPVEHARSLFKLSEALAKESRGEEESERLRKESKRLLLSRSSQAKDVNSEKTYDDLVFIWWR